MKSRLLIGCFYLSAVMAGAAMGANPVWNASNPGGGNNHLFFATPPSSFGDNNYTAVFIGYVPQGIAPTYMLNVTGNTNVKNGIIGWGNTTAGSIGVFGGNNYAIGVEGWDYFGDGVVGKSGNGSGSTSGVGGRFMHTNAAGTALQVDQGYVNIYSGKTLISNAVSSGDPVLNATYTGTNGVDKVAVKGYSVPTPNWGYGGDFTGGFIGVHAQSIVIGGGTRYAGYFYATGGAYNYGIWAYAPGNANDWAGWFQGKVYSTGGYQPSDEKLKKDLAVLDGALDKVMKLKPVTYHFNTQTYAKMGLPLEKQNGLIAQDVETVFPELVCETVIPSENKETNAYRPTEPEKIKAVNYTALIPILTKAIQEQQTHIETLEKEIKQLKGRY
jgi:hypothetical protein